MAIKVRIPTPLQKVTDDRAEVEVRGGTIQDVIDDLERNYPGVKERICDENGKVRRFVNIYLNDEDIRFLEKEKTRVKDGDEVSIIPAIAGGQGVLPLFQRGRKGGYVHRITELKERVLAGGEISFEEAMELIEIPNEDEEALRNLTEAAHEITLHFHSRKPGLCSLINAKSYLCGEDCYFCAQSVRFDTGVERYDLLDPDVVVAAAKRAQASGAHNFCVVTSGAAPSADDFEKLLAIFKRLVEETHLKIDCSLGFVTAEQAARLKEVGVRRFNNNLQTSREFYPRIVTTHPYETRLRTLEALREGGLELCSGGILGMGETREDRMRLAFELKRFAPECVPVNLLNPRPGTPLENAPPLDPIEAVKTIAVFRFVLPHANIKLAGGREGGLREYQGMALHGGANGLIIGGYLTTKGNPIQDDFAMLRRAGYEVTPSPLPSFEKAKNPPCPPLPKGGNDSRKGRPANAC